MIFDIKNDLDLMILDKGIGPLNVGITSGTFDLFHHMHLVYLQRCHRLCDFLIVGVDSNEFVRERKGSGRPLVPEHQRIAIINALFCVDATFVLNSLSDFGIVVSQLRIKKIFRNQEFLGRENDVVGQNRTGVVIIPDVVQYSSTTELINSITKDILEQLKKEEKWK